MRAMEGGKSVSAMREVMEVEKSVSAMREGESSEDVVREQPLLGVVRAVARTEPCNHTAQA